MAEGGREHAEGGRENAGGGRENAGGGRENAEGGRENDPCVKFLDQARPDAAIAALAVAQHGVFSLDQLRLLGFTAAAIQQRKARGRIHRIHHGVYSLAPRQLLTRHGHWLAAVLACGPDAALSHRTAAALYGLRDTARLKVDVTVPGRAGRRRSGIEAHRSTSLAPADITRVQNIPCTSVARTLLDLAEVVSRRALERAFDQSEILEVFDLHAIEDQLARNPTRSGAATMRTLLKEHYIGSTPTQSELEEAFLALTRRLGLPDPQVNEWVDLGDEDPAIWADFVWRRQRVIVETDGQKVHGTHQASERDPRRDQRALVAGWRPLRTTWRQVTRRAHELGPTLLRLVGARESRC